ncbi:ABC transporter permease [Kocuria sp. M1R5S2]|uniref:ABC transporter permease n=1 Tax=Kocuria rhizosphaerae TaxID=3376285 RepID=UPI00378D6D10
MSSVAPMRPTGRRRAARPLEGFLADVKDDLRDELGRIRLPEFVLGFLLVGAGTATPLLPLSLPLASTVVLLLGGLALFRVPERSLGNLSSCALLLTGVLGYLVVVSVLSPVVSTDEWTRRIVRLTAVVAIVFFFVSRRLDLVSLLKGLATGMVVNAGLFYAGVAPDRYVGYLTGYFGDKNQAGLHYAVVGILLLALCRRRRTQFIVLVLSGMAVWLTGSRTSMAAYAFGVLWILVSPKLGNFFRILIAGAVVWILRFLEENLAQVGVFADREGSDQLRDRIQEATELKIAGTPFEGMGLGQAFVWLEDEDWFFHDAYATLFVEGGYPYVAAIVGITVLLGFRPFRRGSPTRTSLVAEGATLAVLICAWQLGEVFMTVPWALVMAMALMSQAPQDTARSSAVPERKDAS